MSEAFSKDFSIADDPGMTTFGPRSGPSGQVREGCTPRGIQGARRGRLVIMIAYMTLSDSWSVEFEKDRRGHSIL